MKKLILLSLLFFVFTSLTFAKVVTPQKVPGEKVIGRGTTTLGIGDTIEANAGLSHAWIVVRLCGGTVSYGGYVNLVFAEQDTHVDRLYFIPDSQEKFTIDRLGTKCDIEILEKTRGSWSCDGPLKVTVRYKIYYYER